MRTFMDASYELNGISPTTGRETVPQVSLKVYPKGRRVVSAMERTGAKELIASLPEVGVQPVGAKNLSYGDTGLEELKAIGVHLISPF
jgi:hypothetical protein